MTPESILHTFQSINKGEIANATFSDANVVMLTKDAYAVLSDAHHEVARLTQERDHWRHRHTDQTHDYQRAVADRDLYRDAQDAAFEVFDRLDGEGGTMAELATRAMDQHDAARAEVARLREALDKAETVMRDMQRVMGPKVPPCCDGWNYEWLDVLRTLENHVGPYIQRKTGTPMPITESMSPSEERRMCLTCGKYAPAGVNRFYEDPGCTGLEGMNPCLFDMTTAEALEYWRIKWHEDHMRWHAAFAELNAIIEGLADQQAMPDDSWVARRDAILASLKD